jgi:gliding motility-associatede transport system auxiliary component
VRDALRISGWAGLVLFVMGWVSYAFSGAFDLWTAVHVAGGGVLLLVALAANLADVRRTVAARGTREKIQAGSGTVVFAAILIALNVLAARFPKTWDYTESKVYTLSDKTHAVLAGLAEPVELGAFFPPGDRDRPAVEQILERYAAASPKVHWRFIDPEKDPTAADRFGVTRSGVLAAVCGTTSAQASGEASGGYGEGAVTSLILKVARPRGQTVYALTGHGEADPADVQDAGGAGLAARALSEDGIAVKPLLLAAQAAVPADADAVLILGPRKTLIPHEVEALRAYLARGGRLLAMVDPGTDPGLEPLLADLRLSLDDDMIVDKEEVAFFGARLGVDPIVEDFPPHPITKGFKQRIILSQARSIKIGVEGGLPGVVVQPLARTHESAWGAAGWREMLKTGQVARSDADASGPLVVAATASLKMAGDADADPSKAPRQARVVLVGDSDWASNGDLGAFYNREFLSNAVHWLTGSENLIVGPEKHLRASRLDMTVADERNLFRFGVLLLPEVLLIGGLASWLRRRSL